MSENIQPTVKKPLVNAYNNQIHISPYQTKKTEEELPNHLHDWHEIIYIHRGSGTFLIDQQIYEVVADDIFVIPGNIIHRAIPLEDDLITSTVLFLPPLFFACSMDPEVNVIRKAKNLKKYRYKIIPEQLLTIEHALRMLSVESESKLLGQQQAMMAWTQIYLIEISRHALNGEVLKRTINSLSINDILGFIDENLHKELTLELLAERENLSAAHFSRIFKQEVGLNLSDYLLTKRISLAKALLLESNENIDIVAGKCGFRSMPHFYRSFKRMTDITPKVYRKEVIMLAEQSQSEM